MTMRPAPGRGADAGVLTPWPCRDAFVAARTVTRQVSPRLRRSVAARGASAARGDA